jgi:EAL domain-containing protein (putative c-di-GMP-specific phosphodiesterase class I)/GGDEF domain-containing protein
LQGFLDSRRQIGVLHVEIFGLDLVESLYGWQTLDKILSHVATCMRGMQGDVLPDGTLLAINTVAGDRFIVFLPKVQGSIEVEGGTLAEIGRKVCDELTATLDEEEFVGLNPRLEFRVGHALLSENPFYRFERRIHAAVEEARARPGRMEDSKERASGDELLRIIQDSEVHTLFHPIVDLRGGEILGYEALSRGPQGSIFETPVSMFAMSGRVGQTAALDRLCRTVALESCEGIAGAGKLFLNVSPESLSDPEWRNGQIIELLEAASLSPEDMVLELPEPGADHNQKEVIAAIAALRSRGFGIALDNVGSGYSSLATLERLCPDYLKVDTSLIRDVNRHLIKQEALASLVQIANRLGSSVIAEGIESAEEVTALIDAGVRFGQGFHFARPEEANGFNLSRREGEMDH